MNRRDFTYQSMLATSIGMADPSTFFIMRKKHLGVQLWSVRDVADVDPPGTLGRLADMGYREVEGHQYGNGKFYSYTPKQFKDVLKDAGIKMPSAHTGIELNYWDKSKRVLTDAGYKTIEDHAAIGVKQLICPWVDASWRTSENLKTLSEILNAFGAACKKEGVQFGYHNHDFEFNKVDGKAILEHIMNQTDPELVVMELDLYWVQYAKEDPAYWINHLGDRIHAYHVKDMAQTEQRETIEVGDGIIDFESLFILPASQKVKYYIVELEHYRTTSMQGVEESLKNLKQILQKCA